MNPIRRPGANAGMAIVIVLVFAFTLLVLGSAYLKTFSTTKPVNPKMLERLQADCFAQGIAQIAMLKFKRFPADFYHAYIHRRAGLTNIMPTPLERFQGAANTPLQDFRPGGVSVGDPVPVATYSTWYNMISYHGYNRDALEINVSVRVGAIQQNYVFTVDASRTRLL
ncbi:MAG TPA: hypothetical protein VIV61_12580 [Candidatus Ozemobacteraceae bacterium]